LLNTDISNCYITLEFIAISLRVRHPLIERPPYSEEGTAAQVPKEDQCPRTNSSQQAGENDSISAASKPVSKPHGKLHFFTDEKLFTVAAPTS